jgi:hypothetical protein
MNQSSLGNKYQQLQHIDIFEMSISNCSNVNSMFDLGSIVFELLSALCMYGVLLLSCFFFFR